MSEIPASSVCTNCGAPAPDDAKFCPSCGQKSNQNLLSLKTLLGTFWMQLIHVDGKILTAARHLLIPAKLSREYFAGRVIKYPNPLQLFFVAVFFFLAAVNYATRDIGFNVSWSERGLDLSLTIGGGKYKSAELTSSFQRYAHLVELWKRYEALPDSLRGASAQSIADTLLQDPNNPLAPLLDSVATREPGIARRRQHVLTDSINVELWQQQYTIAISDWAKLSADTLNAVYGVQGIGTQAMLRQLNKLSKDPNALGNFYLGSFTWTFLVLVLLMAALLRQLFRRRQPYYVGHLIYQLHIHASGLMWTAVGLFLGKYTESTLVWLVFMAWLPVAYAISLHRFYGIRGWRLLGYWLGLTFIYTVLIVLLFTAGLLVAMLLF